MYIIKQGKVWHIEEKKLKLLPAKGFNAIPGKGVKASVAGKELILGNLKLIEEKDLSLNGLGIPRALPWTSANFRVAADGERFLVMLPDEDERQQLLVVITDWRNELRRLGVAK